ncbi:MAG: ATP-binding cassette domain-containing protein, partial [Caulobacteraceae bacterium]
MKPPPAVTEGLYVDTIGKSFGDRPVVKSVSLRLGRGEVAGLLGPNGAGKTT